MIGDICIRLKYINGRREVTETVEIVGQQDSLFKCRTTTGLVVFCNGYQLVKLNVDPAHASPANRQRPLEMIRLNGIRGQLRRLRVGTFIASVYREHIYIGQLQTPYVSGPTCEILFWIPVGNNSFREPELQERERNSELTHIEDIILTDVLYDNIEANVIQVPTTQFEGSVV
jgi:hypothetical protein